MKEEVSENDKTLSPTHDVKSNKGWSLEYLIGALVITTINAYIHYHPPIFTSSIFSFLNFIAYVLGGLIALAIIAGLVTLFRKSKYLKNLFWTSVVFFAISLFGQFM